MKAGIERANGTFLDRLVVELRVAGASSLAVADQVLDARLLRFSQCFGAPAEQLESAFGPLDPKLYLAGVFCIEVKRQSPPDALQGSNQGHQASVQRARLSKPLSRR